MADDPIVVVGASLAGVAGVEELRRRGYDGGIVLIGDEDHHPYDRPPLSKGLPGGDAVDHRLRPEDWAEVNGVDVRLGTPAVGLDLAQRAVRLRGGERLRYRGLLIATGAGARMPEGWAMDGVFTLRTFDDATRLWSAIAAGGHVAVIGGGFNGAEVAATACRLGAEVTLISNSSPLERSLGPMIGAHCATVYEEEGVRLRTGVPVVGIEAHDRVEGVRLADGSVIAADVVVVGYGVSPHTEWLADSGLALDDGVLCDAYCRASAPAVVAAGDVARWQHPWYGSTRIEHWENAVAQGCAAVGSLLELDPAEPYAPVPYAWSDQFDHTIQVVGRPQVGDKVDVIDGSVEDRRFAAVYCREDQITGAVAFDRPSVIRRLRAALRDGGGIAAVGDLPVDRPPLRS